MPACSRCGVERRYLQSHHIIRRRHGGTDDSENLLRLCSNCHEDEHGGSALKEIKDDPVTHEKWLTALRASMPLRTERQREYFASERSAPHRRKLADAQRKRWSDPAERQRMGEKVRAAWTPERRAAKAEEVRQLRAERHWSTRSPGSVGALDAHRAEAVEHSVERRTGVPLTDEHRRKLAVKTAERWDAGVFDRTAAVSHTPEANAKRAESMRRAWAEGRFANRRTEG